MERNILARCTVVVEVPVTYHALDRGVRDIYQTGGFDGAFVCQYDGRAYDYIVAYIAHFHFWSIRSGCYRATTVVSVLFSLFMLLIDTLVSFIQAYVFTMLSTLFIALAQVDGHHEGKVEEIK